MKIERFKKADKSEPQALLIERQTFGPLPLSAPDELVSSEPTVRS